MQFNGNGGPSIGPKTPSRSNGKLGNNIVADWDNGWWDARVCVNWVILMVFKKSESTFLHWFDRSMDMHGKCSIFLLFEFDFHLLEWEKVVFFWTIEATSWPNVLTVTLFELASTVNGALRIALEMPVTTFGASDRRQRVNEAVWDID